MGKRSRFYFRLLISLTLMLFIFTRVDLEGLRQTVLAARPLHLGMGLFLLLVISPILGSLQIVLLLKGQKRELSVWQMLHIDLSSRFYGIVASGLGHGAVRWYRLGTVLEDRAVSTVCLVFNRLAQTLTVVGVGFVCWLVSKDKPDVQISLFLFGLMGIGMIYGILLTRPVRRLGLRLGGLFLPERGQELTQRLIGSAEKMAEAGPLLHFGLFLLSAGRQVVNISATYFLALSMNAPVTFYALGWVRAVGFLVSHLPISVAGVGVREVTYLNLLLDLGVESNTALAVPLLLTTTSFVLAGAGGLLELRRKKL